MIKTEYLIAGLVILIVFYFIFFRTDTFINRKLENFDGDDLNVHYNNDLNIINEETNIIE